MRSFTSRLFLALFFIAAGVNHFISPAIYAQIVPPMLPWPEALAAISGAAEIAGGAGILWQRTRWVAALGLILLLIAVFPANIYAALNGVQIAGREIPDWILWARLPFQPLLIAWVYLVAWKGR